MTSEARFDSRNHVNIYNASFVLLEREPPVMVSNEVYTMIFCMDVLVYVYIYVIYVACYC